MYEYKAKHIRAIDGDTVELLIDLGCDVHIIVKARLYGINAPECKNETHKAGINSQIRLDYLVTLASNDNKLLIRTIKDKTDKYGRLLGLLYDTPTKATTSFEESINHQMIREGYAIEAPNSWNR